MDETGRVDVYGNGGDYMHVALHALMNSVCNYLECQVSDAGHVSGKPVDVDEMLQCKLDQAADLVKKHLLCSVREEMEVMKGKLSDLEMKIYRLEMENTLLLREYVPASVLRRLSENSDDNEAERWDSALTSASYSYSCVFDQDKSISNEAQELTHISVPPADTAGLTVAPTLDRITTGATARQSDAY